VEAFSESAKLRPDHPASLMNAALACWCSGDLNAAEKMFQEALKVEPESQQALRGLAALALELKESARAHEYCDRLAGIGETTADLRYNIALLFHQTGDAARAAQLYRAALDETPEFPEALLNLGHALKSLGDSDEARTCWSEAIRQKPELAAG
jgi:tetratricopeptide (TPR) repeat protein